MIDAVHGGFPVGGQRRNHQGRGGTQVGGHHRRTGELLHPAANGGVALHFDVGAHAIHFLHVHEAVFKYRLDNGTGALGNDIEGHELGLHVGGHGRVRRGTQGHRFRAPAFHVQFDPVVTHLNAGAGFLKLLQHGVEDGRVGVLGLDAATGDGGGDQVGAGLDAVGNHLVMATGQACHPFDGNGVGAGPLHLAAHGVDEVGQVHHLWLTSGVFQHRGAIGQGCGHHQVFGAGHRHRIHDDTRPFQATIYAGMHIAVGHLDIGAHGLQPPQMDIHWPRTDGTATGQRHRGLAEMRHHRTQHQNRGAHGLHQLVGRGKFLDGRGVHFHIEAIIDHHMYPHATEQLDQGSHILQVRQVAHGDRLVGQQGGSQNRQGGVLGAGNSNFAVQTATARDDQFIHGCL